MSLDSGVGTAIMKTSAGSGSIGSLSEDRKDALSARGRRDRARRCGSRPLATVATTAGRCRRRAPCAAAGDHGGGRQADIAEADKATSWISMHSCSPPCDASRCTCPPHRRGYRGCVRWHGRRRTDCGRGSCGRSGRWSSRRRMASLTIRCGSVPTRRAVPASTPSGRSVVVRITSTGLPNAGASSCTPPESVSTMSARDSRSTKWR